MERNNMNTFRLDVPAAALDDLQHRLAQTRWPDELPGQGWSRGVPLARMRELVEYWRTSYDWRRHEAALNGHPQFTTTIDGQQIHLLHVRSPHEGALPIVLTHGWPSSVFDFLDLIEPLTRPEDPADAFHVVIPAIPGFGFSGPTREAGWSPRRVALAWAELMRSLGYERYGAQGGDSGAYIAPELGRVAPEQVVGVHVHALVTLPSGDPAELEGLSEREQQRVQAAERYMSSRGGYIQLQMTRPQTLAYALTDSPAGQLAWNLELLETFGDPGVPALSADTLLTQVMTYWLTQTAGSSARLYAETPWETPQPSPVPTAVAVFPGDIAVRRFAEREHTVARWTEFDEGGHFPTLQAPGLWLQDLRAFFRELRASRG
jgi:pimeloyl-ACP methyl ester carboxylesterase